MKGLAVQKTTHTQEMFPRKQSAVKQKQQEEAVFPTEQNAVKKKTQTAETRKQLAVKQNKNQQIRVIRRKSP